MGSKSLIDHRFSVHVLTKHYESGSKPDILAYFYNITYACLAFEYEVKQLDGIRKVWIELNPYHK